MDAPATAGGPFWFGYIKIHPLRTTLPILNQKIKKKSFRTIVEKCNKVRYCRCKRNLIKNNKNQDAPPASDLPSHQE